MKKFVSLLLISLIFSCKTPHKDVDTMSSSLTIESTEKIGGKYQLSGENDFKKIIDKLYTKTSTKLKKQSNKIIMFDLYHNETHYIWYASINETDEIYRFISDKTLESISFEKVERAKIKQEIINFKN